MIDEKYLKLFLNKHLASARRGNGYAARKEIAALVEACAKDPRRLEPFGFKVYSQAEEDGIIEEIFRRLGVESGWFCEIGVQNGLECNSLYLIHKGWQGAWIEGNGNQLEPIKQKFGLLIPNRLKLCIGMATVDSVNEMLDRLAAGREIDFLSIDIDGNDIHLMEAMRARPKVICIEYNAKFPGNIVKRQVYDPQQYWRGTDYFGSSLKALSESAGRIGYGLVGTNLTGSNAFFVRNDLLGHGLFCEDRSPEFLYNPPRYYLIDDHYQYIGHPADFGPYEDLVSAPGDQSSKKA
jgi:hypothetical protein